MLDRHVEGQLPDIVGPRVRLLFVGINPGRRSAELGLHFAGIGNRFWPALHAAGLTPCRLGPEDQGRLPALGIGLTNLVARASARASELTAAELQAGGAALARRVQEHQPAVVAILGVTAYRQAFGQPGARFGRQESPAPGATAWWVLPNPSGLNAHTTPAEHAVWLRRVGLAARLPLVRPVGDHYDSRRPRGVVPPTPIRGAGDHE